MTIRQRFQRLCAVATVCCVPAEADPPQLELTVDEQQWLADHPRIRLAPDPDFPPVEFLDDQGQYRGIAADFLNLFEQRLGIRFEIVHLDSWATILQQTQQRRIDLLGAIVRTPQRQKYLLFSEPFLVFPGVIVAAKSVNETLSLHKLRGMKVAIVEGYTGHEVIARDFPDIHLDVVPDTSTGLRKAAFGLVDAFVGNLGTATFALEQEGITNLRVVGETGHVYRWSFGSRSDWPMLQQILNKALASITDQERKELRRRWVKLEPVSLFMTQQFWLVMLAVVGCAALALIWVVSWNRLLKRQVRTRTTELEHALNDKEIARDNIDMIFKSIADGLIVANMENELVLMNRAAEELLQTRFEQAQWQPLEVLFNSTQFSSYVAQVVKDEAPTGTVEWPQGGVASDGCTILQARTAVVKNREGKKVRTITILRDITHERQLDQMKTEFISTAAHELRTPLTAVMGYTELLLNSDKFGVHSRDQQREFLQTIYEKAGRLETIVSDLLDLSRVQSGRLIALQCSDYEITDLIRTLVAQYQQSFAQHHFQLEDLGELILLWGDGKKLEQVLDNLISNAVKFSAPGSRIWIRGQLADQRYQVTIQDEGLGMSAQQVHQIFDKFYRADSSDTAPKGLGLGMSIVKKIIEAHDGSIWVESTLGVGTSVHFALPLTEAVQDCDAQEGN